jgi:hypothetical protein
MSGTSRVAWTGGSPESVALSAQPLGGGVDAPDARIERCVREMVRALGRSAQLG